MRRACLWLSLVSLGACRERGADPLPAEYAVTTPKPVEAGLSAALRTACVSDLVGQPVTLTDVEVTFKGPDVSVTARARGPRLEAHVLARGERGPKLVGFDGEVEWAPLSLRLTLPDGDHDCP